MTEQHISLARWPVCAGESATSQASLRNGYGRGSAEPPWLHQLHIPAQFQAAPFDKKRFVIEVLRAFEVEEKLNRKLKALKEFGYKVALDEFVYDSQWNTALNIADIINNDVIAFDEPQIKRHVELLKPFNVTLLAEKVATREIFHFCKGLGLKLFQGYFLGKPQQMNARKVPSSKVVVLNLLAQLQDPNFESSNSTGMIAKNPVLNVKLIKLVHYAELSGGRNATCLQHAISLLVETRAKMGQFLQECFPNSTNIDPYLTSGLRSKLDAFDWRELKELNIGARELQSSHRECIRGASQQCGVVGHA